MKLDKMGDWRRTHYSADIVPDLDGQEVIIFGWVHEIRDLGGLRFVIIQDKTGQLQITIHKNKVSGDVVETNRLGDMDEEYDEPTRVQFCARFIDPNIITSISPNGPHDEEANWFVKFTNGTSHTYNSLTEVKNFIKLYQMLKD